MKRLQTIGYGILTVFFALAFAACPTSVDVRLEPTTASITGRALFNNGTSHGGIVVTLEETSGPRSASVTNLSRGMVVGETSITAIAQTDAQGRFFFRDVPPGTYTLHARSWDSLEGVVATIPVIVRAGDELDVGILNLTLAGSISGQVTVNGSSAGTAGFIVSVAGTSFMAVTCDEGMFRISGVPAGDHRLIVVRGNFTVFIPGTVSVSGGVNTYLGETKNITSEDLYHNTPRIVGGYWWVGNRNLGVPATGPQGDVPFIGEDGYWWIGTERTDVPARGPQGPAGVSIVWKGELAAAPAEPQLNWAFFNTHTRNAYIWNGTGWYILAQHGETGADGDAGAAGVSINWRGTFEEHPENPELNWAYHNSVRGVSYIFDGEEWQVLVRDGVVGPYGPKGPEGPTGFVPVINVSLDEENLVLALGQTHTLTATVTPDNATITTVLWSSSRPNVASVDMFAGKITVHAPGKTTITVLTVHGGMTAIVDVTVEGTVAGPASPLAGRLLILQAGAAGTDGAIGRSFIELYNNTDNDIDLDGFSLQYAAGSSTNAAWSATETAPWTVIPLTGIIPARGSFLVAGHFVVNSANQRFTIADDEADLAMADFRLSNRSFKVALMANSYRLTVADPSTMGGGTAIGLVDLLGALNSPPGDGIDAFETAPVVGISQQASVRRQSLVDTDNNSVDFARVDFRHIPNEGTPSNSGGTSIADFERVRPRGSSYGAWTPFPDPSTVVGPPSPLAGYLLILQAGAAGTDGAIPRSFIELYNNTDAPIDLSGFSLHFAAGSSTNNAWFATETAEWTMISLTGTIPARSSFLVAGHHVVNPANQRFEIMDADADLVVADMRLSNRSFKVALMANPHRLTIANPFAMSGGGTAADFVDLLGALNTTPGDGVDAYETAPAVVISQQASARRRSLIDTNDNSVDFVRIDFRPAATPDNMLVQVRPRGSRDGTWVPFPEGGWSPAQVVFSHNTGLHNNPFNLTITAPAGYAIYYSIDGSIPFPANVGNGRVFRYTAPIAVVDRTGHPNLLATPENSKQFYMYPNDPRGSVHQPFFPNDDQVRKATVIRAVAIDLAGNRTDVMTRTFFIGDNLRYYANHPIISIVTDPHNLLDEDTGIMVRGHESNRWPNYNFNHRGRDWEREAFFELFDGQRNVPLSTGVGIRIRGGWSRGHGQKSLNVFFRDEYGMGLLSNFELIPGAVQSDGRPLTTWRSFALRNGGNCSMVTKLTDAFVQNLVADRSFSTLASIPVIVYLNGEYWGPYNLRERFSDNHIEFRYAVNRNNVIVWESGEIDEGTTADEVAFLSMMDNLIGRDMSIQQNFNEFLLNFDKQNFIDYFAAEIYINNHDWPHHNYRLWRVRNPEPGNPYGDGRWRWQMTDTDVSLGQHFAASLAQNPLYRILYGVRRNHRNSQLFRALLANDEFARQFIITMMDLSNVNFNPDLSVAELDRMAAIYRSLMESHFERWGSSIAVFDTRINVKRMFLRDARPWFANTLLPRYFANLGITANNIVDVTLVSNASGASPVTINTVTPNLVSGSWTGRYYSPLGVTVRANVPSGYVFTGWTIEGGVAQSPSELTTFVEFDGNVRILANFARN